jgi:hypothetical protein
MCIVIARMIWARNIACMGEKTSAYIVLVRKSDGKRPIGRPRHRLEDNIKIDPKLMGWKGVDWVHQVHDKGPWRAVVNMVMNLRVP